MKIWASRAVFVLIGAVLGWTFAMFYPPRKQTALPDGVLSQIPDDTTRHLVTIGYPMYIEWAPQTRLFMANVSTGGGGGISFPFYYSPLTGNPLPEKADSQTILKEWAEKRQEPQK